MKKVIWLIAISSLFLAEIALACSPPRYRSPADQLNDLNSPLPLMQTSANGQYLLKMVPTFWVLNHDFVEKRSAYGTIYKIRKDGELQQLWSIKELHRNAKNKSFMSPSYTIFMDDEGNTIKVANLVLKGEGNPEVIWLYKQGKLLKTYTQPYFVKNTAKTMYSTCATAQWYDPIMDLNFNPSGVLRFKSIDGINWSIKLSNGAVTKLK